MNCPNCGNATRPGASFCGECGTKLGPALTDVATPVEIADAAAPLRRPPPPPPVDDQHPEVPPVPASPPLLVVPPPPPGVPKEVEIVPFGTTGDTPVPQGMAPTITITSPPGIGSPPQVAESVGLATVPPIVAAAPAAESLDETRVSVRRSASNRWRLVLPDARQIEVSGALLVGREPSANPGWPGAALLTISDAGNSVSKTHCVFEADATGLWVTDLDSTNGVVVIQPDGVELDLAPNARELVLPGADVELGDFIVQVEKD